MGKGVGASAGFQALCSLLGALIHIRRPEIADSCDFFFFLPTYMAGNISFHKTKFLALRYVDSECHLPYQ